MTECPDRRTVVAFDGSRVSPCGDVCLGNIFYYDNGQARAKFMRGANGADWFVWSEKRGQRLASYATRRELLGAFLRSDNGDGPYGCAILSL